MRAHATAAAAPYLPPYSAHASRTAARLANPRAGPPPPSRPARFSAAGILDAFSKIYREEGVGAFAKGLGPRMLVQAPLFGITLLSYEVLKEIYRRKQGR